MRVVVAVVVAVVVTMPLVVGGPVLGEAREDLGGAGTFVGKDLLGAARAWKASDECELGADRMRL